jgi:hypothetical protein
LRRGRSERVRTIGAVQLLLARTRREDNVQVCSSRETGPAVSRDGTNRTAQSVPSRVTCAQLAGQLLAWWMLRVLDCASGDARSNRSNGSRAVARRASPRSPQQARMVLAAGVGENAVVTSCSSQMQGPGLLASSGVARTTTVHIGCGAGAKRVVASRPVRTCQQTAAGAGASRAERSTAQHSTGMLQRRLQTENTITAWAAATKRWTTDTGSAILRRQLLWCFACSTIPGLALWAALAPS